MRALSIALVGAILASAPAAAQTVEEQALLHQLTGEVRLPFDGHASPATDTYPLGCVHACCVTSGSPEPSLSESAYHVLQLLASAESPSQSLSVPTVAHSSGAPG